MDRLKERMAHIGLYVAALLKWMAVGALVGGVGGFVGAAFHLGVSYATVVRQAHPWILYLLPVGGVVIAGLYKLCRLEGKGTNAVIESVHFGKSVPTLLVPLIFVATVITHLLGGSAGREGAALQIGGGIGYRTGTLLRLGEKDLPLATLCGMSGVFAALFGTPLTATVFALVSILFCRGLHITEHLAERWLKNSFLRAAVGGLIIVLATLALGTTDYNGAGMDVIQRAVEQGQADGWAWLLKLAFTAVTIGCGFKGGEVVPSFFVGATFGCAAGGLLGLPPSFAAAVGLVAVFCGAVNCPIASVILSVELFGAGGMAYFAAACAVSYLLSGYCGLYSSQTILYSKLRAEFINVHTKE